MVDVPAVMVGTAFLADVRPHHRRRVLKQAIGQLPDELKARVMALGRLEGEYEVDSILGVNSNSVVIEVGGDEGELHVGLFTEAARINHSCRPNAYYRFSPRRLTMEVVAYHAIEAGEEIVMSYVPLDTARSERRQFLKETWGFDCTCSLCHGSELDITNSETWRRRMTDLRGSVLHARREGYFQDAINISKDWLHFSELEMVPPLLAEYHDTLAELYRLKGDLINATRYGRMALDGWVRLGSVEDDQLEKARVFLKDLS
ncbi:hypothetical protein B0T17DRAFT_591762 [Bombardia bombarda]|uniref:SET domain-containing protein n=1 Tax=Bombardia bombarda TaxID=252184 RepID=A0AA40BY41_9PEZI|nr:hypothetical protein B0T17DRAFT_591762 [Bombardia bombarda]